MAENKNIILKLQLEAAQAQANISKLEAQLENLNNELNKGNIGALKRREIWDSVALKQNQIIQSTEKLTQATRNLNTAQKGTNAAITGTSAASGSATASVLELGRTISDSNYGIRGMANNLSQLASNLVYTTKSAGGLVAGFKALWTAVSGPLGLILIFQTVIALIERVSMESDKAGKALSTLASSGVTEAVVALGALKKALDGNNLSLEQKKELIKDVNSEYPDLILNLDEFGYLTEESARLLELEALALVRNARAKAVVALMTERLKEEEEIRVSAAKDNLSTLESILYFTNKAWGAGLAADAIAIEQGEENKRKILEESNSEIQKIMNRLTEKGDNGEDPLILSYFGKDSDKKTRKSAVRILRDYREALFNLDRETAKFVERSESSFVYSKERELQIAQETEVKLLKIKYDAFVEKEKIRLKNYLANTEDIKKRAEAEKLSEETIVKATDEFNNAQFELVKAQSDETFRFKEEQRDKEVQAEFKTRENAIKNMIDSYQEQRIVQSEQELLLAEDRIAAQEEIASRFPLDSTERFLAEQELSQMRMNLQTQELDHELLIIEEKKNAHLELTSYMSQMGGIMANISGNNKALAVASLLVTKGAAVAQVVISANASIASQTAATAAALAKEAVVAANLSASTLNPAVGGAYYAAKSVLLNASLTRGILQTKISAGLSIASILASTISSRGGISGGSTGGSTGGSVNAPQGREFDFNLVGSTGTNQLAQVVGNQVGQSIRAYVVSSEITNQQQLDNQIQGNATIGD